MIKLANSSFLDILPENLKNDSDVIAASKCIDKEFKTTVELANKCLVFTNINNLDEKILDHLAYDWTAPFYDSTLDIETKRNLVRNALILHKTNGTAYAVEKLIEMIFGDGKVLEWFDYDGEPYTFRVETSNTKATNEMAETFKKAVNSVKNMRSHLEKIVITFSERNDMYFSGIIHIGDNYTIRQVI